MPNHNQPDRHRARDQQRLIRTIEHHGIQVVFDVGANVGQYAGKLRRLGFGGKIVSFEPLAETHQILARASQSDPSWIVAPAMALGGADGSVTINRSAESDMSSALDFNLEMAELLDSSHFVAQESVRQRRLDGLLGDYAEPGEKAMLKIDTQGSEQAVLEGAAGVLDRIALIQIELSIFEIYEGETGYRDMIDHLGALGFEPVLFIPGYFNDRTARMLQMDGVFARRDGTGTILGQLAAVPIETPWWQEADPVVRAFREHHGIDITVLRLLETEFDRPHGGLVTYLAEVDPAALASRGLTPWTGDLSDHPKRLAYAKPSGPAAEIAWATDRLRQLGLAHEVEAKQMRSWNLSSLWCLSAEERRFWLKTVPPFFAHEGPVLSLFQEEPVPQVIAHEGGRLLMAEIPGEDLHGATLEQRLAMVRMLVDLQVRLMSSVDKFLALGVPDWRPPFVIAMIEGVLAFAEMELDFEDRQTLGRFIADLPNRFESLDKCGIPSSMVHGDFHPGNVRGDGNRLTLIDWGDCGIGHPLLDQPSMLAVSNNDEAVALKALWADRWREHIPGCDAERATVILAPIAAARQAAIYHGFLRQIEPSEQVYHRHDPADWLRKTAAIVRSENA